MKQFLLCYLLINFATIQAQLIPAPASFKSIKDGGKGGKPIMDFVIKDILRHGQAEYTGNTIGSPYTTETFIAAQIYYDGLKDNYYVRYNALNDEMELKQTTLPEEKIKALIADEDIEIRVGNNTMRYITYKDKKESAQRGYFYVLVSGENHNLYRRQRVKYTKGRPATNSMVQPTPNRFAHFAKYYYTTPNNKDVQELELGKRKFLNLMPTEIRNKVFDFITEKSIDLKNEKDLIKVFEFIKLYNKN